MAKISRRKIIYLLIALELLLLVSIVLYIIVSPLTIRPRRTNNKVEANPDNERVGAVLGPGYYTGEILEVSATNLKLDLRPKKNSAGGPSFVDTLHIESLGLPKTFFNIHDSLSVQCYHIDQEPYDVNRAPYITYKGLIFSIRDANDFETVERHVYYRLNNTQILDAAYSKATVSSQSTVDAIDLWLDTSDASCTINLDTWKIPIQSTNDANAGLIYYIDPANNEPIALWLYLNDSWYQNPEM